MIDIPATWPDLSEPDEVAEAAQDTAVADDAKGDRAIAAEAAREALENPRTRRGSEGVHA